LTISYQIKAIRWVLKHLPNVWLFVVLASVGFATHTQMHSCMGYVPLTHVARAPLSLTAWFKRNSKGEALPWFTKPGEQQGLSWMMCVPSIDMIILKGHGINVVMIVVNLLVSMGSPHSMATPRGLMTLHPWWSIGMRTRRAPVPPNGGVHPPCGGTGIP